MRWLRLRPQLLQWLQIRRQVIAWRRRTCKTHDWNCHRLLSLISMELVSTYIVRTPILPPTISICNQNNNRTCDFNGCSRFYSLRSFCAVQKMLNFQNLQNLASLQQQKLGFVGLAGLTSSSSCLNSPLNLSLSSSSHPDSNQINANCNASIASELAKNLCAANAENFSPQMPQLILASVSEYNTNETKRDLFVDRVCVCAFSGFPN